MNVLKGLFIAACMLAFTASHAQNNNQVLSIEGVITKEKSSEPLPKVKVELRSAEGASYFTTTDANGRYSFEEDSDGNRMVQKDKSYTIIVGEPVAVNVDGALIYTILSAKESTIGVTESTAIVHDFTLK